MPQLLKQKKNMSKIYRKITKIKIAITVQEELIDEEKC